MESHPTQRNGTPSPDRARQANVARTPSLGEGEGALCFNRDRSMNGTAPSVGGAAPSDQDPFADSAVLQPSSPASEEQIKGNKGSPPKPKQRPRRRLTIIRNIEDTAARQQYIFTLAKALLHFGSPTHRLEDELESASQILEINGHYVYLPGLVIVSFDDPARCTNVVHFVKANGHVALSTLHKVHEVSRKVLHDKRSARAGTQALRALMHAPPTYPLLWRCFFAFLCAACISPLEFGGSIIDMVIAGLCSAFLTFFGIRVASRDQAFATVFEITMALVISLVARVVATLPGNYFCYNAISSAGIIFILPGFTVLIGSLEITTNNVLCGAVRIVYAIIYTLFLGFSLFIGSSVYLGINKSAEKNLEVMARDIANPQLIHGKFTSANETHPIHIVGRFIVMNSAEVSRNVVEGCFRDPSWAWWRQPLPWWTELISVPVFSLAKSLANLQTWRSRDFPVMIIFSCLTFLATRASRIYFSARPEVISAVGAMVIGGLGCAYGRICRRTAFTVSVTGVLFLVPVALAGDNGLAPTENSNRAGGVLLAMRMIQVAVGVVAGIYVSHSVVYAFGRKKTTGRFTF